MGKKNKLNQRFSPHQGKGNSEGGGFKKYYKGKFSSPEFQRVKLQEKRENAANKDKNFVEKFEQKQHDKTAASLKNEISTPQQTKFEINGTANKQQKGWKNIKSNDGLSAVHVSIKQQLDNNSGNLQEKQKQSVKRKFTLRKFSSSSSDSDEATNKKAKLIEEPAINGKKNVLVECESSDSGSNIVATNKKLKQKQIEEQTAAVINGKRKAFLDESDNLESDLIDEEGDDLTELTALDDATMEDEEEDEELTEFGSFIADEDEELEEDDISSDESNTNSIDLSILGFKTVKENANCLILEPEGDYSIATGPFKLHKFSPDGLNEHSVQVALKALQWVLNPVDPQLFFSTIFQKRVLVVRRSAASYYDEFFNVRAFTQMLQNNFLQYGKDLNVASYENGRRLTHNSIGEGLQVTPAEIAAQLAKGRSIQCVHPQVFNDHIWYICEILQEVFCSFVGANNYLTPASSAGFAPHWDDIDAFMLQVEGKKYWKIYAPENAADTLPLDSSQNFTDDDFIERQSVFEGWLEQGDVLYVPRGFVHQANTGAEMHSHHVTISVCRHHSYADFFEIASLEFIKMLTFKSKHLRYALPPCFLDMNGAVKTNFDNEESMDKSLLPIAGIFARKFGSDFADFVPSFIDLLAQEFFKTALPPLLSAEERELSCFGGPQFDLMNGPSEIDSETEVRLIRKHSQRLLFENEEHQFIVHRMANSRRYNDSSVESIIDFPIEFQRAYITLADSYPKWTKVGELGLDESELNIKSAKLLFDNGLVLRRQPTDDEKDGGKKGKEEQAKNEVQKKKKEDDLPLFLDDDMGEEGKDGGNTGADESSIMVDDGGKKQKKKRVKKKKNKFSQNKEE